MKTESIIPNKICEDCLKWEKFKHDCNVFWEGKKICSRQVKNVEELEQEARMLK